MLRNTIIPALWAVLFGALFAAALWFSVPANASPSDVCSSLDRTPTVDGLLQTVGFETIADDLAPSVAARMVVSSIYTTCPWHIRLLDLLDAQEVTL